MAQVVLSRFSPYGKLGLAVQLVRVPFTEGTSVVIWVFTVSESFEFVYDRLFGGKSFTSIDMLELLEPLVEVAVTLYVVRLCISVGVPEITQFVGLIFRPAGKAESAAQELAGLESVGVTVSARVLVKE